jgi:hypothetical protein
MKTATEINDERDILSADAEGVVLGPVRRARLHLTCVAGDCGAKLGVQSPRSPVPLGGYRRGEDRWEPAGFQPWAVPPAGVMGERE